MRFTVPKLAAIAGFFAFLIVAWSPFSGGPRLPSLVLAMIGVWLLVRERQWLLHAPAARRLVLVFLLLWVPVAASLPGSLHPPSTWSITLLLPVFLLAGLAITYALGNDARRRLVAMALGGVMLFWVADSLLQLAWGRDLLGHPIKEGRVTGLFEDLHQGLIMAVILPSLVWAVEGRSRWLAVGAIFACGLIMAMSGARTYLVYFLVLLAGFVWHWRTSPRWAAGLILLPVLVVAGMSLLTPALFQTKAAQTVAAVDAPQADTAASPLFRKLDHILSYRMSIWQTGWNMFSRRPVFGVGAKAFENVYRDFSTTPGDPFLQLEAPHAHQMYVAIAAETGLVGLAGILAAIFLCMRWYSRAPPERRAQAWPYGLGLLVIVFPFNSQTPLFTPWWFPVLLLLLCAMLAALDPPAPPSKG